MPVPARSILVAASVAAAALLAAGQAAAWGSTGHRIISRLGILTLPGELPAFLQDPVVVDQIGELGREPDRSRGSGQPHDADLDPGHFIDLTDDGLVLGGLSLDAMPPNKDAYSAALAKVGGSANKSGWLYYSILDGYQQLAKDFAYWRLDVVGEKRAADAKQRAWYAADRKERELIIVRDLGYWSHFVGDASMPMHVSVHYNGWGDYPNPNNYTQDKIHGPFEGAFVHDHLTEATVKAAMTAPTPCAGPVAACTVAYFRASQAKVAPLYALWTDGAFKAADPGAVAFDTERVAAGASALRDLIVRAWRDSGDQTIGRPGVRVSAIEAGAPLSWDDMYGDD
jgi:hypothetical protein